MSDKDPKEAPGLDEFLNPASMLTPGLAGALTMLITNALSAQFQLAPSWTALLISFLCGTLVFVSNVGMAKKLVFYVLNSLIIFSVAAGTSGFAARATQTVDWSIGISPVLAASRAPSETAFDVAQAATTESAAQPADLGAPEALREPLVTDTDIQAKLEATQLELEAALEEAAAMKLEGETTAPAPVPGEPSQADFELAFWKTIQASDDPGDYQAYLETYPEGSFAALARFRVQSLEVKAAQEAERRAAQEAFERAAAQEAFERAAAQEAERRAPQNPAKFFKNWF